MKRLATGVGSGGCRWGGGGEGYKLHIIGQGGGGNFKESINISARGMRGKGNLDMDLCMLFIITVRRGERK